jgi:hypothetical protein
VVRRRSSRSRVVSQRDGPVRSQTPRVVDQNKLRRRATSKHLSLCGSARPRLWEWVNVDNLAEGRHLDFVNRSRRLPVADLQVKHAVKERERRVLMVSRNSSRSRSGSNSRRGSNAAAHLAQPSVGRGSSSKKVGRREHRKKRHPRGRINFEAITPAAPERETPEPLLFVHANLRFEAFLLML